MGIIGPVGCRRLLVAAAAASVCATLGGMTPAVAHVTTSAGPLRVTMGWREEPAYTGVENSVQVQTSDATGAPVTDVGSSLIVEVSFNDERLVLPLVPSGRPGEVQAVIVPTSPGVYGLHASGKVRDQAIDISATCGDNTFACVADASEVQFPVKEPSAGQIRQRLDREQARLAGAKSDASRAGLLALIAVAVAVAALALAAAVAVRARRAPTAPDVPQGS